MGASLESSRPIMAPSVSLSLSLSPSSPAQPSPSPSSRFPHRNLSSPRLVLVQQPVYDLHTVADHVFPRKGHLEAHLRPLQHLQRRPLSRQHRQDDALLRLSPAGNQGHRERPPEAREQETSNTTLRPYKGEDRAPEQPGIGSEARACLGQENGRTGCRDAGSQEARSGREALGE